MEEREESEKSGLNVKQSNKTGDKVDVSKVQDNQTKPKIGDTRPAPDSKKPLPKSNNGGNRRRRKRRRNKSGNNKSNKSVSSEIGRASCRERV